MINRLIIVFIYTFLLGACAKDTAIDEERDSVFLNLGINTRAISDPISINGDHTFSSLAYYLFNDDENFTLDKAVLLPSFPSVSAIDVPIKTQVGRKIIYLIANYSGESFRQKNGSALILSESTTKEQLDNLIVESRNTLSPNSLLMLAKKNIDISKATNGTSVAMSLRRLQARIDVHVYKGENFGVNNVTLESVTFVNQVLNSEAVFESSDEVPPKMLTSPRLNTKLVSNSSPLSTYQSSENVVPQDAEAIFYSYQNIVSVFSPLQISAPYLKIKVNANGTTHDYKGYITDINQVANRYSLLQNNVYQINAILDLDSKMILNIVVLPWDQTDIEYGRPIVPGDFSFGEWGSSWGGVNAKAVHTNMGMVEDAVFEFKLNAPKGAAWTASLSNGLDFMFPSSTQGAATTISKGFADSVNPAIIAVRAAKKWKGNIRHTEFYITVEGKEIPINPFVGAQRKYEGTDTRIKITQVASSD